MESEIPEHCEGLARQQAECERNGHPFHQRRRTYEGVCSAALVECTGCRMVYESELTREENISLRRLHKSKPYNQRNRLE